MQGAVESADPRKVVSLSAVAGSLGPRSEIAIAGVAFADCEDMRPGSDGGERPAGCETLSAQEYLPVDSSARISNAFLGLVPRLDVSPESPGDERTPAAASHRNPSAGVEIMSLVAGVGDCRGWGR